MLCPKCGAENNVGTKLCEKCGQQLIKGKNLEQQSEPANESVEKMIENESIPKTKFWDKKKIAIAAALGLALLGSIIAAATIIPRISARNAAKARLDATVSDYESLSGDIKKLQADLESKREEAKKLLAGTKPEELADANVLQQLQTEIDASKGAKVTIPARAATAAAIDKQITSMETTKSTLEKKLASLNIAIGAISKGKQELAAKIEAERKAPKFSNTWNFRNDNYYSYTVTINIWQPLANAVAKSTTHPANSQLVLGSGYKAINPTYRQFNPATDIVIPGQMIVTNTTDGFSMNYDFQVKLDMLPMYTKVNYNFVYPGTGSSPFSPTDSTGKRFTIEQRFSSGAESTRYEIGGVMDNNWGLIGINFNKGLASKESKSHEFFIIVSNYYSSIDPNGDSYLLDHMTLQPLGNIKGKEYYNYYENDNKEYFYDTDHTLMMVGSNIPSRGSLEYLTLSGITGQIPQPK